MRKKIIAGGGIIVAVGLVGFLILQVLPLGQPTNPPVVAEPQWDSPQTRALAKRACFDCHSNEATFPWYAYVAPVKWLIVHDVTDGRRAFNFSDWHSGDISGNLAARKISGEEMPPSRYLALHPTARLTDTETQQLISGLIATMK
jgi:mono/diheme cytochrome c family protein